MEGYGMIVSNEADKQRTGNQNWTTVTAIISSWIIQAHQRLIEQIEGTVAEVNYYSALENDNDASKLLPVMAIISQVQENG